jgi:uncharacterized protein (TIGR03086 family)
VRATLDGSVELLERALGYTRVQLTGVHDHLLDRPTPCVGWSLADLLAHMEDALDAFTEAAGGAVEVRVRGGAAGHVTVIQEKACALLGSWSGPAPGDVVIRGGHGGLDLDSSLLVATAALEVTVHGWDVGQSTGSRTAFPDDLARSLLPVARAVVAPSDRGVRFAPAGVDDADAPYGVRLLAFLGRT